MRKNKAEQQKENIEIPDQKESIDYTDVNSLRPKHPSSKSALGMRTFTVARQHDQTGVSGDGIVLEGVEFAVGITVIHWRSPSPTGSVAIFMSLNDFIKIHITPHPDNRTILTYDDGTVVKFDGK